MFHCKWQIQKITHKPVLYGFACVLSGVLHSFVFVQLPPLSRVWPSARLFWVRAGRARRPRRLRGRCTQRVPSRWHRARAAGDATCASCTSAEQCPAKRVASVTCRACRNCKTDRIIHDGQNLHWQLPRTPLIRCSSRADAFGGESGKRTVVLISILLHIVLLSTQNLFHPLKLSHAYFQRTSASWKSCALCKNVICRCWQHTEFYFVSFSSLHWDYFALYILFLHFPMTLLFCLVHFVFANDDLCDSNACSLHHCVHVSDIKLLIFKRKETLHAGKQWGRHWHQSTMPSGLTYANVHMYRTDTYFCFEWWNLKLYKQK